MLITVISKQVLVTIAKTTYETMPTKISYLNTADGSRSRLTTVTQPCAHPTSNQPYSTTPQIRPYHTTPHNRPYHTTPHNRPYRTSPPNRTDCTSPHNLNFVNQGNSEDYEYRLTIHTLHCSSHISLNSYP